MPVGIQIDSTSAYSVFGSPSLANQAFGGATSADNYVYEFIHGTRPQNDIAVNSVTTNEYHGINSSIAIKGIGFNRGADTIKSFDLNYQVGSSTIVTANVSGQSFAPNSVFNFTHPTNWIAPATYGLQTVKLWTSNINSGTDANPMDDTASKTLQIVDTFVVRNSLLEVFTSSTCGPCVTGNQNMDNVVIPKISNYTVIKYQQNFPGTGDPYYTSTSVNRRGFYGINSIPRMEIDGQWDQNASSLDSSVFVSYQNLPSFVSIDINSARHSGKTINVDATINPLANLTGNLKYHVVVTEKKTTGNTGSNGETEFFHVMMEMIPDENGSALTSLNKGTVTNVMKQADLDASNIEEDSDLKVVVFVQDMTTGEVFQSQWADISASPTGINELSNELSIQLYPNPTNGILNLNYSLNNNTETQISIIDIVGKTVFTKNGKKIKGNHKESLDLSHLKKGVYLVSIKSNNVSVTKKLIIE